MKTLLFIFTGLILSAVGGYAIGYKSARIDAMSSITDCFKESVHDSSVFMLGCLTKKGF